MRPGRRGVAARAPVTARVKQTLAESLEKVETQSQSLVASNQNQSGIWHPLPSPTVFPPASAVVNLCCPCLFESGLEDFEIKFLLFQGLSAGFDTADPAGSGIAARTWCDGENVRHRRPNLEGRLISRPRPQRNEVRQENVRRRKTRPRRTFDYWGENFPGNELP